MPKMPSDICYLDATELATLIFREHISNREADLHPVMRRVMLSMV
jgi:hypothetical protein